MAKENVTLEFRLKKMDKVLVTNYLLKDMEDIDLISEKHKTCIGISITLSIILLLFLLSVDVFQLLHLQKVVFPAGNASSAAALQIYVITAEIKKYNSIARNKEKRMIIYCS